MLRLKLQYFGHLMRRANSVEKTLMLGKNKSKRRREWQIMRWLDTITDSVDINLSKLRKTVEDRGAWCAAVPRVTKSQTRLSDRTTNGTLSNLGEQRMRRLDGIINSTDTQFEQTPGDSEGEGSLARYSPWGHKELDTAERQRAIRNLVYKHHFFKQNNFIS